MSRTSRESVWTTARRSLISRRSQTGNVDANAELAPDPEIFVSLVGSEQLSFTHHWF